MLQYKDLTTVTDPRLDRRVRLTRVLEGERLDAIAVSHLPNVRYLTGFSGSNALLLLTANGSVLLTDPRYTVQAHQECNCPVKIVSSGTLWAELARKIQKRQIKHLGLEAAHITHADWQNVAATLGREVKLKPLTGVVENQRMIKSADEINQIREAVKLTSKAFEKVLKKAHPGESEIDVAAALDFHMRKLGADGVAFDTIVAFAERSALPHAHPTGRTIDHDQLLLVDMGASLNGYASDMTRVVHVGKPGDKVRRLYEAVLEAQLAAIDAVRPGAEAAEVDAAARKTLKKYGLDRAFLHSTGHGLGLEIHENPRIGRKSEAVLQPGMAITIEPGAYIEGFGGVRIEDTVLVTDTGVEVLTPTSKELVVIPS